MDVDSIIRVLKEMRLLEGFVASVGIVIFTGVMICLVATVKVLVEKRPDWVIKGRKKLDSPS